MGAQGNVAPVIIKRKKIITGGGHHGGAWKVAISMFLQSLTLCVRCCSTLFGLNEMSF